MSSSTQRSAVIDMCKGFGIVLVVYGHCLRGLVASGKIPETSWLNITDYVIYTFHMPLFFVLSGYFFRHPAGNDIRKFCKSKALGIVLPYVLWSLVQGSIQVALASSGATNGELGVDRLYSILWLPISPFWFLYALFFCNLVALATHRIPLALSISIATLFFLTSFWTLHYVVKDIAYGCVYFLIGMAARKYAWQSLFPATPLRAIACWALFAASVWVCFLCDVPDRLSLPAALLGILATLMTAAQLNCGSALSPLAQALALAGRCSMGIFVLHIIALGFARPGSERRTGDRSRRADSDPRNHVRCDCTSRLPDHRRKAQSFRRSGAWTSGHAVSASGRGAETPASLSFFQKFISQ